MSIPIEDIREELKFLFDVPLDRPRWADSKLLNLTIIRNVMEVFELPLTQAPFGLAITLLLTINDQLVPAGPEAPLDAWKTLVACEFNFLSRLRRSTVMILSDRITPVVWVRWEKINEEFAYTPTNFIQLSAEQRTVVIRKSLINLWCWKAHTNPFDQPDQLLWKQLQARLSQETVFSKDVIYESRTKIRYKVAQSLHQTQYPEMGNGTRIADYMRLASALLDKPLQQPKKLSESPKSIQPLPAPSLPQPDTAPDSQAAEIQTIPEDFASLRDWINARFKQTPVPIESVGMPEKSRRLAQSLAAIALKIEDGAVRTPRLVFENVKKALRLAGSEPKQTNEGHGLVDFLVRAGFLVMVDDCHEFVHPLVAQFFAAEYITQYQVHWVSSHPRYHQLMRWAAVILAQRRDDPRNQQFFDALRGQAKQTEVEAVYATFAYIDYLIEFRDFETPAVVEFRNSVIGALKIAAEANSNRLRWVVYTKAQQLGEDVGLANFNTPPEAFMPAASLAAIRVSTDLRTLLASLGLSLIGNSEQWLQSGKGVRALLAKFQQSQPAELKMQLAAWLQVANLTVRVRINPNPQVWFDTPFLTALEVIAQIAMDQEQELDDFTRALARGILAKEEFILQLAPLGPRYSSLLYTLELSIGQRRRFNWKRDKWELVPYSMKL